MLASIPVCVAQMPSIMHAVVHVESSFNPYAIGVVHGRLIRQPRNAVEAIATAAYLASVGRNFSLGIAQVNRYNLERYGLNYETAFESCQNVAVGHAILTDCVNRAGGNMTAGLACYYSGRFSSKQGLGYANHVLRVASRLSGSNVPSDFSGAIPLSYSSTRAAPNQKGKQHRVPNRIIRPQGEYVQNSNNPKPINNLNADPVVASNTTLVF